MISAEELAIRIAENKEKKLKKRQIADYQLRYKHEHLDAVREYQRKYREKNREKLLAYQKEYYRKFKEAVQARHARYWQENKDAINEKRRNENTLIKNTNEDCK